VAVDVILMGLVLNYSKNFMFFGVFLQPQRLGKGQVTQ